MKKISAFSIAILTVFLGIVVVQAFDKEYFEFSRVGQYDETEEKLVAGTKRLTADYDDSNIDATLGLSLSYKVLFGYRFISRCNLSTYGNNGVYCNWPNQGEDTYKGTLTFNSSNDNKPIAGTFYLKNV